jgi:gluconate transporter
MSKTKDFIIEQIKERIGGFEASAHEKTVGRVIRVGDGIAVVSGLSTVRMSEMLEFKTDTGMVRGVAMERDALPGFGVSLVTALVPVILMLANAIVDISLGTAGIDPAKPEYGAQLAAAVPQRALQLLVTGLKFFGNPNIALMIAVLFAVYVLGVRRGRSMDTLMRSLQGGVASIAGILLIIAAGGAFSQVLRDGGVSDYITHQASQIHVNPLTLAFGVAALLRASIGSATVAGMTAAGVLSPMVAESGVHPELMVLATGAGSLMFSHFNDSGFWMFKEYFNATIRETLMTWSVMELIVGVTGLAVALLLNLVW